MTVVRSQERTERAERAERPDVMEAEPAGMLPESEFSEGSELISLASTGRIVPASPPVKADTVIPAAPARKPAKVLPRAPRLRTKALRAALAPTPKAKAVERHSVEGILQRYANASDLAHGRLEAGMRVARLNRLFAASRLTPGGGVTDTRMSLAGAGNVIRVYRQQQAAIEEAYQDSVTLLAKRHGWTPKEVRRWYSRPQRKEDPTLELLSGSLIGSIDSVLGMLTDHAGAYKVRGTAIAFEDPMAAKAYGALRRRIKEQIDSAVAAGGATSSGATGFLLQAIGTTSLPRET